MARASTYFTRQSAEILKYLKSLGGEHCTAGQVVRAMRETGKRVSPATVYRRLDALVDSGQLRRFQFDGEASASYQFVEEHGHCDEHFHLKCECCGDLIHLECGFLQNLQAHIKDEHAFTINTGRAALYGRCGKCAENRET